MKSVRELSDKFLVAFSFAGEQRNLVRAIAEAVEARLGRGAVFLDEWFEHYIAGEDADLKLREIYADRCELAVICVSQSYESKPWTQAEHRAVRARYMRCSLAVDKRERESVLPIRVGDGEVNGILFNAIVPDVRLRSPADTAELIMARLELVLGAPLAVPELSAAPPERLSPGALAHRAASSQRSFDWPLLSVPEEIGLGWKVLSLEALIYLLVMAALQLIAWETSVVSAIGHFRLVLFYGPSVLLGLAFGYAWSDRNLLSLFLVTTLSTFLLAGINKISIDGGEYQYALGYAHFVHIPSTALFVLAHAVVLCSFAVAGDWLFRRRNPTTRRFGLLNRIKRTLSQ